ncbi:protein trichome birefringence-like 5 [Coffea eugenioides]|uniref:protein trichome birefringence-like 5 n=1 Tax=Coffea eugenioides TaxID=49369 RepID=UPI000F609FD0|nr:protein trichome birefringence-like 5 [Coffea eugenioides]
MEKEEPVSEIYSEDFALWKGCGFYKGKWVKDEQYPIYRPGSCPYVDEAFDCQSNGRPDSEYLKWRWKPDGCDLPSGVYWISISSELPIFAGYC